MKTILIGLTIALIFVLFFMMVYGGHRVLGKNKKIKERNTRAESLAKKTNYGFVLKPEEKEELDYFVEKKVLKKDNKKRLILSESALDDLFSSS